MEVTKIISLLSMYSGTIGLFVPFLLRRTRLYRKIRHYQKMIYTISAILAVLGLLGVGIA